MGGVALRSPSNSLPSGAVNAVAGRIMALGEACISLEQGVVVARENLIPTIHVQKFNEVAKNIFLINRIYAPIALSVAEKRWQGFSPANQAAIQKATRETSARDRKAVADEDDQTLGEMKARGRR